jgi:hypothetical protein
MCCNWQQNIPGFPVVYPPRPPAAAKQSCQKWKICLFRRKEKNGGVRVAEVSRTNIILSANGGGGELDALWFACVYGGII